EYNAFEFQDAIAQRNFSKAIRMIQYFESNNKAAPIQLILPTLYSFFSKVYAAHGSGARDENTMMSQLGVTFYAVKNLMIGVRNYPVGKVQHILILIQAYNLKVLGINDADNTDADLLKELVVKIMDPVAMDISVK
ncbi:MAG: DNA polymerase III subunit delta, partial [Sediminibacterium sp.]